MKKKFVPVLGDLSKLTKDQQDEYVLAACDFLHIPPEFGLVSIALMDVGDGARQALLYVKRGGTDIVREHLGISVDKLEQFNGDGYVGWTATGHNPAGRTEMAVGAVSTKGLGGPAIANCVKTAQTQALRRMTLQFAGGGFLDETELNEKTTNIVNSKQSLAQIAAQPSTVLNAEAGKDVTPATTLENLVATMDEKTLEAVSGEVIPRKKRRKKTVSLDSPISTNGETQSPSEQLQEELEPIQRVANNAVNVAIDLVTAQSPQAGPAIENAQKLVEAANAELEKPSDGGTIPTQEQKKAYREQLSKYVNDILPKAGFLQSEKLGSRNDKMKLFAQKMFPNSNVKCLSVQQWDSMFLFLQDRMQSLGVTGLVQLINDQIGDN